MKAAKTGTGYLRLSQFFAQSCETAKRGIRYDYIRFFTQKRTHRAHTTPPHSHFETLLLQKSNGFINIIRLSLPQRYKLRLKSIAASIEIKAGETYIRRHISQVIIPLVSTRTIAVQIEHDIFCLFRQVKGQSKRNVKDLMMVFALIALPRLDQGLVISESARPDYHIAHFLNTSLCLVFLY